MRDLKRIDNFTNEFNRIWKTHFPDWRFGQLCLNFLGFVEANKNDPFFPEEDEMLSYLKEFCNEDTE